MHPRLARLLLVILLLSAATLACITGGTGGSTDPEATQMAEAAALDLTATFGAQVFTAQLTAIAQEEGQP